MHQATTAGQGHLRHFEAQGLSEESRATAFRQQMLDMFSVGLKLKGVGSQPLAAGFSGYRGKNLRFAAVRFSPHSTVSVPVANGADTRLLVSLHKKGPVVVSQAGRESRIETDDIFVIDPAKPFYIETGEIESYSLYLKAADLRHLAPELDVSTARALRTDSGIGAVFRSTFEQVFALGPTLVEDEADEIAEALLHLLAPLIRSSIDKTERCPNRLAAMHRQRIVRFVRENLGDCDLDAEMIARGVNLSSRHVYQLFDGEDKPLMRWVWSERMAHCRNDLANPLFKSRSIGDIALAWGFSNVSHFSRAFKGEFGVTPRDFRRQAETGNGEHLHH